jgi:hypothetical protein
MYLSLVPFNGAFEMLHGLLDKLANTKTDAKFASFTYRAKGTGELAKYRVILGESTKSLYEKDIIALKTMIPMLAGVNLEAATAILKSRETSLAKGIGNNPAYTCANVYEHVATIPNVKIHMETGALHVCGLVEAKETIEAGTFKDVKSSELTIAKRKVEKLLPSGRFRQFVLENVQTVTMDGDTLTIE